MRTLSIKDGTGAAKTLQVEEGDTGIVSAQAQVAITTTANEEKYYTGGASGWNWSTNNGTIELFGADLTRRSVIVNNSGSIGSAYILIGSTNPTNNGFGSFSDKTVAPPLYTFILEPGATYFGDTSTCGLKHSMFVPSSSLLINSSSMIVSVTEIF